MMVVAGVVGGVVLLLASQTSAMIPGVEGPSFSLTAKTGQISTPEGNSIFMWGYANGGGLAQYIGPTLLVDQGDTVQVTLTNQLDVPVSIVFPGQAGVTSLAVSGDTAPGLLTLEALPGGVVRYRFVATNAGTYHYHSGTDPSLQIEMGLLGIAMSRYSGCWVGMKVITETVETTAEIDLTDEM